jgi:hypothetical protein
MITNRAFRIRLSLTTADECLNKPACYTTSAIPFKYKFH